MDFPEGAVVVAEGRQPWINPRNTATFNPTNNPSLSAVTLIGYLRLT